MKATMIGTIELNEENRRYYDDFWGKEYRITGETLKFEYGDGGSAEYVVFSGDWTRSDTVRDCGDHFIKACHSEYISIDKETLEITRDVEDR